jgi:hypothetical protein
LDFRRHTSIQALVGPRATDSWKRFSAWQKVELWLGRVTSSALSPPHFPGRQRAWTSGPWQLGQLTTEPGCETGRESWGSQEQQDGSNHHQAAAASLCILNRPSKCGVNTSLRCSRFLHPINPLCSPPSSTSLLPFLISDSTPNLASRLPRLPAVSHCRHHKLPGNRTAIFCRAAVAFCVSCAPPSTSPGTICAAYRTTLHYTTR